MPSQVFVSYVQENRATVTKLVYDLRKAGVTVWFDRDTLPPGVFWRDEIRSAVRDHEFFLACFSNEYLSRQRTYMNEELHLAVEEVRQRGNAPWFIPILLSGEVPDLPIGGGRTLRDIQFVDLTGDNWNAGMEALLRVVQNHRRAAQSRRPSPDSSAADDDEAPDPWAGIDLDRGVLQQFLNEHRLARHLDSKIASFTRSRALHETSEIALDSEVAALAVAGFHTTAQLDAGLRKHKRLVEAWAEDWLGGVDSPVSQGVSLTYLSYVVLAVDEDAHRLLEFAVAAHIHPADEKFCRRVFATYHRLARENGGLISV